LSTAHSFIFPSPIFNTLKAEYGGKMVLLLEIKHKGGNTKGLLPHKKFKKILVP